MTRRLYTQVYLGLLVTAVLCAELTLVAVVVSEPPIGAPSAALGSAEPGASAGEGDPAAGSASRGPAQFVRSLGTVLQRTVDALRRGGPELRRAQLFVLAALVSIAIGARPIARRITRRLERLQAGVEELGSGDLTARVEVDGRDEVAELARSFNRAADRIQQLVGSQRRMLGSASHELRTPLTRIRMVLGLLSDEIDEDETGTAWPLSQETRRKLLAEAEADIEELDALIGDLLLSSRLTSGHHTGPLESVDLLRLVGQEAERFGAAVAGKRVSVRGNRRALQLMVRNLLENTRRHAGGRHVEISLEPLDGAGARLVVADRGPGVPVEERERIFEPFYQRPGFREGEDGGAGLGLALVREVAHFHGGEARCLEREGGGTRFEVDLYQAISRRPVGAAP